MAYLHSLVKADLPRGKGWCAPCELGEAAPHYISFVVPVDAKGAYHDGYECEVVASESGDKVIEAYQLLRQGPDSFLLILNENEIWFRARAAAQSERQLRYVGQLQHEDFAMPFVEIEPEDPDLLDRLFEVEGRFVIGCEPFIHYVGVEKVAGAR
jgi:hypothetical protein